MLRKLYGLLGERLTHSFSPKIHTMIFKKEAIDGYYNLFEVKRRDIDKVVNSCKILGVNGLNVTIPYKVDIMSYLDEISEESVEIGAVNTIAFRDDKAVGYNTDYFGFGRTLRKFNVNLNLNSTAVILGTGGASKAVYQYLIDNGVNDIVYVSRNPSDSVSEHKVIGYNELKNLKGYDILINTTPCGMFPNIKEAPLNDRGILLNYETAIDLIYNPIKTKFLLEAEGLGLKVINGLYMLVAQAVKAEELWNDIEVEEYKIDEIYNELKEKFR